MPLGIGIRHLQDVLRAWHDGTIPKSGNVTDIIEYELHGIGCFVFFPDREVNFDFGPELWADGFDLWRLKDYLNNRPDISKSLSKDELETNFYDLIKRGVIKKIYQTSNLYFFRNEYD